MKRKSPSLSSNLKSSFSGRLLFFFYPPKCAACGEVGYGLLCPRCEQALKEAFEPKLFLSNGGNGYADTMTSLFSYQCYEAKKLILLWKKLNHPELTSVFCPLIQQWYREQKRINCTVVTFIPRRKSAKWKHGFDQAEKIAAGLSAALDLPLEKLLRRHGFSKSQHSLPTEKRRANVAGAFRPNRKLRGETVLLVDDIVTSGASAAEAARILKKAGAQKVFVLCLAH